jgi:hypothetical protein
MCSFLYNFFLQFKSLYSYQNKKKIPRHHRIYLNYYINAPLSRVTQSDIMEEYKNALGLAKLSCTMYHLYVYNF